MPRRSVFEQLSLNAEGGAKRVRCPDDAPPDVRRLFDQVVASCRVEHFRESDVLLLIEYCEVAALTARANAQLRNECLISPDGSRVNPLMGVLERARKSLSVLSRQLRLTPQSRLSQTTATKRTLPPST